MNDHADAKHAKWTLREAQALAVLTDLRPALRGLDDAEKQHRYAYQAWVACGAFRVLRGRSGDYAESARRAGLEGLEAWRAYLRALLDECDGPHGETYREAIEDALSCWGEG